MRLTFSRERLWLVLSAPSGVLSDAGVLSEKCAVVGVSVCSVRERKPRGEVSAGNNGEVSGGRCSVWRKLVGGAGGSQHCSPMQYRRAATVRCGTLNVLLKREGLW